MASQVDAGIPFGFSHDQQAFRLLELPPALLAALESPNPPTNATGGALQSPGLCAIASPKVTLELHHVASSPLPHLRKSIPIFHGPESRDGDLEMMASSPVNFEKRGKDDIFANTPACEEECERGWTEIAAFELYGGCVRPSIWALLSAYKAIFSAATSQGIELESRFLIEDLWQAMEDDDYPRAFVEAVLARLAAKEHAVRGEWASVDKSKCIAWLGTLILETQQGTKRERLIGDFLEEWKDNLPEPWRENATLDSIEGFYIRPSPNTIRFNGDGVSTSSVSTNASAASSGARKWHEKFRSSGI
ncbi:MAG: hypothetical protein M1840_004176 [Geoglossum simile]|nr:MAG: hypothetical protein M1840_004176 [Geoglossum simile]